MSSATDLYPAPGAAPGAAGVMHPVQAGSLPGSVPAGGTTAAGAGGQSTTQRPTPAQPGALTAFEGFLKKAGHIAGVVLSDVVKYAIPVATMVSVADPAAAPAVAAFTASVKLIQAAVISVQQKWVVQGSSANVQKLADVLELVEQPVITMFAQAGLQVDTAYVTNLVNGVVAILNSQPGVVLPSAA